MNASRDSTFRISLVKSLLNDIQENTLKIQGEISSFMSTVNQLEKIQRQISFCMSTINQLERNIDVPSEVLPPVEPAQTPELPSEPLPENTAPQEDTPPSKSTLIKTLPKWLVETNWPYMRVKNVIKRLNFGTTRISHYDGLILLAEKKGIHINELIKMDHQTYYKSMSGGYTWTYR